MKTTKQTTTTPAQVIPAKEVVTTSYICEACSQAFSDSYACIRHEETHKAGPTDTVRFGPDKFYTFLNVLDLQNFTKITKAKLAEGEIFDPNTYYCFEYSSEYSYGNNRSDTYYLAHSLKSWISKEEKALESCKDQVERLNQSLAAMRSGISD